MKKKIKMPKRFKTEFEMREKYILRDFLAMERTTLANERTLFSYVRMGLYLSLAAIAFIELEGLEALHWVALVMFIISALLFIFGFYRYQIMQKKLNQFYSNVRQEQLNEKDTNKERV